MNPGDNIKRIRKSKKITQVQLANAIHKSESTIQKYEANNVKPDFVVLNEIADALGCTLMDLVDTENKADPYFSYYLEDYLKDTGYRIDYDEDNAAIFLASDKECYEITEDDIKDIKSSVKSFIQFKLSEIMKNSTKVK